MEYRSVLEVLKLCDIETVVRVSTLVSGSWHRVSDSNELWDNLNDSYSFPCREDSSPKLWFRTCWLSRSIPILLSSKCTCYALPSLKTRTTLFETQTKVNIASVYCWLSPSILLCCGGGCRNTTYEIHTFSGQIRQLANIFKERSWAGIVKHQNLIYIIGGSFEGAYRQSAEKYDPPTNSWRVLEGRLIKGRNGFTPFVYADKIYCAGRWDDVEVLNPDSEFFTALSVKLPMGDYWGLSVVVDNYMIVVRGSQVLKYDIENWTIVQQRTDGKRFHGLWSNCSPVRHGTYFYSVINGNPQEGILRLNVETLTTEVVANFCISLD